MTQPVDVPLLGSIFGYVYPVVLAALALFKGLVVGAVATFVIVKLLGQRGVAGRWRVALTAGAVLFLGVTVWSWLSWSKYSWIRVTANEIELHYATWPRPALRIPFQEVESVSLSRSGRRRGVTKYLVITTKPAGALDRTRWESAAGDEEHITLAIQWIEHASGGRLTHPSAAAATR